MHLGILADYDLASTLSRLTENELSTTSTPEKMSMSLTVSPVGIPNTGSRSELLLPEPTTPSSW